jgi:hypothetical protein
MVMFIWLETANVKRLKEMRCMGWKPEWNNTLLLAVFGNLKGKMAFMVVKQKKPVFPFCSGFCEPVDVLDCFE